MMEPTSLSGTDDGQSQQQPPQSSAPSLEARFSSSSSSSIPTTASVPNNNNRNDLFPCIEQPPRVTLRCCGNNGHYYYLQVLRNGRVVARQNRSQEKASEFRITAMIREQEEQERGVGENKNKKNLVQIYSHKFGGALATTTAAVTMTGEAKPTTSNSNTMITKVICVKEEPKEGDDNKNVNKNGNNNNIESIKQGQGQADGGAAASEATAASSTAAAVAAAPPPSAFAFASDTATPNHNNNYGNSTTTMAIDGTMTNTTTATDYYLEMEDEAEDGFEDEPAGTLLSNEMNAMVEKEDKQWCLVKSTTDNNKVFIKSVKTGEYMGIDKATGTIVFCASSHDQDDSSPRTTTCLTWEMEYVTGELCFLSNPTLDSRLRCDMAGLLSLTDAWKGWEVFRFMEASMNGSSGYVKISSWMHSQWLLGSRADGSVTTCSRNSSVCYSAMAGAESNSTLEDYCCTQWAIEKCHGQDAFDGQPHQGVIIRSKTHGRLLCLHQGELRTYDPENPNDNSEPIDGIFKQEGQVGVNNDAAAEDVSFTTKKNNLGPNWWSNGVKNMNHNMRNGMKNMQKRFNGTAAKGVETNLPLAKDTIVWRIEAAHLQTYYFISASFSSQEGDMVPPRSLGPFPQVTANLRRTEKIQLVRDTTGITKLMIKEKNQFISCSLNGEIVLSTSMDDPSAEWIMEKSSDQAGGSVFRSRLHNLYLSYKDTEEDLEIEEAVSTTETTEKKFGPLNHLWGGKKEKVGTLVGVVTLGDREVWKLEPCMPRAVSSEKIKTFALGTSIAVGTTIVMPFALAGVGAILGAVGAEVGVVANVIAAGLAGAEALASVGAIGATAYIVFRPEDNSLTDDHKNDKDDKPERAWSKRPFSNWRNW